jgi:Rrf2 family protein
MGGCLTCGVKLSVKSDYAARAVLGLARAHPAGKPVRVESLAGGQGIPPKYLTQILIELKGAGLVRSVRGAEGGYLLARPPAEITLGDVLRAVHGQVFDSSALADTGCAAELRDAWRRLQRAVDGAADGIHFQSLIEAGADSARMYHI